MVSHNYPNILKHDIAYIEIHLFEIGKIINKDTVDASDIYDLGECLDNIVARANMMNELMGKRN